VVAAGDALRFVAGAEPEVAAGPGFEEDGHVFGAHGRHADDAVGAEVAAGELEDIGGDGRVVDEGRAGGFVGKGEGCAEGSADAGEDLFGAAEHEVADRGAVGADRAGHDGRFGDDVAAEAGLDLADGEDRLLRRGK
jgi:hypothetical protein